MIRLKRADEDVALIALQMQNVIVIIIAHNAVVERRIQQVGKQITVQTGKRLGQLFDRLEKRGWRACTREWSVFQMASMSE
jgi:hypothetical protein